MSRLQTFPDGLEFDCGRTHVQELLGNAVPPLLAEVLAEVLAREIRNQLFNGATDPRPLKLIPPVGSQTPPRETVGPVPVQYRQLVVEHADRPATSKRQPQGVPTRRPEPGAVA